VGKLIVDQVVAAIGQRTGAWGHLAVLLAIEFAIAVVGEGLSRLSALLESLLGDLFANRTSVDLMRMRRSSTSSSSKTRTSTTSWSVPVARRSIVSGCSRCACDHPGSDHAGHVVGRLDRVCTVAPRPVSRSPVVPSLLGETHFASLGYSLLYSWTPERRLLDYLRYIGASDVSAKEVKLFGLSDFLVRSLRRTEPRVLRGEQGVGGPAESGLYGSRHVGTLGYYGAYVVIIYLTVIGHRGPAGVFTIGVLTFLTGSFRQSRDLIQRVLLSLTQVFEQSLYLDDLFSFLALEPTGAKWPDARPVPVADPAGLRVRDVGFRYPGSDAWAVRHLDFRWSRGADRAGGENGAGKDDALPSCWCDSTIRRGADPAGRGGSAAIRHARAFARMWA
jgi:ATP-binding cassette subfamily B protein